MKLESTYRLLLFIILLFVFFGCEEGPLKFSVRYDTLGELKSKVPIYFEKTQVGHIEKIVSTDRGDYLVEVSIVPEHKGKATENSKFFILDDPFDSNRKALVIEQAPLGGTVLRNGSIVQGEKRQGFFGKLMTNLKKSKEEASGKLQEAMQGLKESVSESSRSLNEQLEKSLDDIDRFFQEFSNQMDSTLNDDELEKLQQALDGFIDEFKRSSGDIQDQIREDILPQLRRDLEALRDRLKKEGREYDFKKIEVQINEISNV